MTTNFPSGLDDFTNPTSGDTLDSPDHATQHADVNDAVEALQAKVGVNGSAVTTALDYRVATLESPKEVLYLEPNTTNLGTVTSVSASSSSATYALGSVDAEWAQANSSFVHFSSLTTDAYNALSALSSGDTLTLGSWASDDGNPTSVTVDYVEVSGSSTAYVYFTASASNYRTSAFGYTPSHTWTVDLTFTSVVTDNSNLALSKTYFEIGDLTPFVSAGATVSSGTITLSGDFSSSISTGMSVAEKSYTTKPNLLSYNLADGEYQDAVFASTSSFGTRFFSSNFVGISSSSDLYWGLTFIEFPTDWDEWVVEANYGLQTSTSTSGSGYVGYAKIRMIDNPTTIPFPGASLNESTPYVAGVGGFIGYNAASFVGNVTSVSETSTLNNVTGIYTNYSMSFMRHSSWYDKPTTLAIFGFYDPRYSGSASHARATVTVRRLK